jgi:hypothetical protein
MEYPAVPTLEPVKPFDLELHLPEPVAPAARVPVFAPAGPGKVGRLSGAPVASDADVQYWYDVGFAAQLLAVGKGWTDGRVGAPRRTVP